MLYLNAVAYLSDAGGLVKALKESTFFRILKADKEVAAKCMDVAFNSKFSDV